ncbi:MAG: VCBS repeat-containing protein [Bacteroidota bacterium]
MKFLTRLMFIVMLGGLSVHAQSSWKMHTIDNSSKGADGAKLTDVDGDGLLDILVGWEQGHHTRLYHHPGLGQAMQPWSYVEVPSPNVEDAQAVDLNGDGFMDVVSCSEGEHMRISFHFSPANETEYWHSDKWRSVDVPCTVGRSRWMFVRPMDVDGKHGIDLIIGSKHPNGTIGWLESPKHPEEVDAWVYHEISPAGWIMSIEVVDMDGDQQRDVLISDRKGSNKGLKWFKHPGHSSDLLERAWPVVQIGLEDKEPMFLDIWKHPRLDTASEMIWVATHKSGFYGFLPDGDFGYSWKEFHFDFPKQAGTIGKSIAIGLMNHPTNPAFVTTYEGAGQSSSRQSGVMLTTVELSADNIRIVKHKRISDGSGSKFDFAQLVDMDGDGDLDVLTCEEANNATAGDGLGVIWYENPG